MTSMFNILYHGSAEDVVEALDGSPLLHPDGELDASRVTAAISNAFRKIGANEHRTTAESERLEKQIERIAERLTQQIEDAEQRIQNDIDALRRDIEELRYP